MMISTAFIIVVGWFRPFDSSKANKLEMFTECVTMGVCYCLMLFTDFVGDPETRFKCGNFFIAIVILYAVVHLSVLLHIFLMNVTRNCRWCKHRRWLRKKRMERAAKKAIASKINLKAQKNKGKRKAAISFKFGQP